MCSNIVIRCMFTFVAIWSMVRAVAISTYFLLSGSPLSNYQNQGGTGAPIQRIAVLFCFAQAGSTIVVSRMIL